MSVQEANEMLDDGEEDHSELSQLSLPYGSGAHLRPGIVHRLDKGTTGMHQFNL